MNRSGFKLCQDELKRDSGKCFSLIREVRNSMYQVLLGEIHIHSNLLYNMRSEDLSRYILGKLNKGRCFRFEYDTQFGDQLRVCISIERELDFHFTYGYSGWKLQLKPKTVHDCVFPMFVNEFGSNDFVGLKAS